jgi:hypothetical protein
MISQMTQLAIQTKLDKTFVHSQIISTKELNFLLSKVARQSNTTFLLFSKYIK